MASADRLNKELGLTKRQKGNLAASVLVFTDRGIILVSEIEANQDILWKLPGGRGQINPRTGKIETAENAAIRELHEETRLFEFGINITKDDLRPWHPGPPYSGFLRNHESPHWKRLFVVGGTVYLPEDYIDAIEHGKARGEEDDEWICVAPIPQVLEMDNMLDPHREAFRPLLERAQSERLASVG